MPHPRSTGEQIGIPGVEIGFSPVDDGFDLHFAGHLLLRHRLDCPAVVTARGAAEIAMRKGNFRIEDAPTGHRRPAAWMREGQTITLSDRGQPAARLTIEGSALRLETLLPGALMAHYSSGVPLIDVIRAMTLRPAELLGLPQGRLTKGAPADMILVDLGAPYRFDSETLLSKSRNSPFDERLMQGRVLRTIVSGQTIFQR